MTYRDYSFLFHIRMTNGNDNIFDILFTVNRDVYFSTVSLCDCTIVRKRKFIKNRYITLSEVLIKLYVLPSLFL